MTKPDRRIQRTRDLLQDALIALIREQKFDAITIQDIVDRANVGRTTFYLHFTSKEELLMSCHESVLSESRFGPLYPVSREELLSPSPPSGMVSVFRHLGTAHTTLHPLFQSRDNLLILQRIRDWSAKEMEASLHAAFVEGDSAIPFDVLASYLAGAQLALLHWWVEKQQPYSAEKLAQTFHQLRRASICDALGISGNE